MPLLLTVRFVRDPAPERRRDAVEDFAQRHRAKSGFYDHADAQRRDWRGDRFELATVGFGQLFERAVSEWLRELPELYLSRSPPVHGRLSDAFAVPLRRQCDELRSSCEHRVTRTTQSLRRRDTSRRVAPSPRRHLPPHHIAPRRDGDTGNSPSGDNHDRSRGVEEFRSVSRQRRERSARPSRDAVERFERQTSPTEQPRPRITLSPGH